MSRNLAHAEAAKDSFRGLLETLTHDLGGSSDAVRMESDSFSASEAGSAAVSAWLKHPIPTAKSGGRARIGETAASAGASRQVKRSSPPEPSAKSDSRAGRMRLDPDATTLSYEKALQLHNRNRSRSEVDYSLLSQPPKQPAIGSKPKPGHNAAPAQKQPQLRTQSAVPASAPGTKSAAAAAPIPTPLPQARKRDASPVPSASPASQSHSRKPASTARTAQQAAVPATLPPTRGSHRRIKSNSKSRKASAPAAGSIQKPGPVTVETRESTALVGQSRELRLEQRKSIVSIRLNDSELDQLRLRAVESGISVSAYMRSCVLEAEHLRAQVKQALAQMRTLSLRGEPAQLPQMAGEDGADPSRAAPKPGTAWSRFLERSATFLLGPWFAARSRI